MDLPSLPGPVMALHTAGKQLGDWVTDQRPDLLVLLSHQVQGTWYIVTVLTVVIVVKEVTVVTVVTVVTRGQASWCCCHIRYKVL